MKKILLALSVASLLITVGCNRRDNSVQREEFSDTVREEAQDINDSTMEGAQEMQEGAENLGDEVRGTGDETIEREEDMHYETEDRLGRPVEDVQVEEVERKIED